MPNWCSNDLVITGKPKMLNKLLKQVTTTASEAGDEATSFDFNKVIPRPANVDWYSWSIENWGTKWNACDISFLSNGDWLDHYDDSTWESGEVTITFQTAWSPPVPVLTQLSKDNPSVKIVHKFYETGAGFYGTYEYKKGMITVEEQGNFGMETPCEIYIEYLGDSYHHYCQDCGDYFDCEGEVKDYCVECEAQRNEQEKELWELDENTSKAS